MDRLVSKYIRINGVIISLLLFIGYIGGTSLFAHDHTIEGRKIVHSHPYSGTPDKPNHSHTTQQIDLIAALSQIILSAAIFSFFAPILPHVLYCITILDTAATYAAVNQLHYLRAPPSVIES